MFLPENSLIKTLDSLSFAVAVFFPPKFSTLCETWILFVTILFSQIDYFNNLAKAAITKQKERLVRTWKGMLDINHKRD